MITENTLTLEWIQEVSKKHRKADSILVEKVIRALLLLEGLAETDIKFIFKGGTALMLLFDSAKRLSIDIDIIIPEEINNLQQKLEDCAIRKGFFKVENHERTIHSNITKSHFKFYYHPIYFGGHHKDNILLDVLFEDVQYQKIKFVDITSSFVSSKGQAIKVYIPSFEDLLGDKLTAFAPQTTGIPYHKSGKSKAMEIIKQLYDIGNLFDYMENVERVSQTFHRFAITELNYRGLKKEPQLVLDDIFQTALTIASRGKEGGANFKLLQDGISKVKAFIYSESYYIEKAIVHASKAAYLSKLIEYQQFQFERFGDAIQIKDWWLEQPFYTKLNKLKKSNPEAFFYWFKVWELEKMN